MATSCLILGAALVGCDGPTEPEPDGSPDGGPDGSLDGSTDGDLDDGSPDGSVELCPGYDPDSLDFEPRVAGLTPEGRRVVQLAVGELAACDLSLSLSASPDAVISLPAEVVLVEGERLVELELTGEAVGEATVTAELLAAPEEGGEPEMFTATLRAEVVEPDLGCTGEQIGAVGPGVILEVAGDDQPLAGAMLRFPDDDELPSFEATIRCGDDLRDEGSEYVALGPAVTITGDPARYFREVEVRLPFFPALMPVRAERRHLQVFYQGPGQPAPRLVPFANRIVHGGPGRGELEIATQRLGTFQVVVAAEAGSRTRLRHYTFRGLAGVSMGGGGAANIGLRNPELFDFIAPLGGPSSWLFMINYMETYHLGGFCPVDPADPDTLTERYCEPPPPRQFLEFTQEFEHWFYPDGWSGQGGTFNRSDYCKIFRDLSYSLGNPAFYSGPDQRYLPPGVSEDFLEMSDAERCANPAVLTDFYHAEYNPDGSFPVITFCDGNEDPDDVGRWDPTRPATLPLDIALAVDLNSNSVRDPGEPVIFMGHERYDDLGVDGLASEDESGYDPATNPDPADDDWNYLFNPNGTEGNLRYDEGEPYRDHGLDGVAATPQLGDGGYDFGEGNGEFDWSPNIEDRYFVHDGHSLIEQMDDATLDRIDILADGGVRDLFAFAPVTQGMLSALIARGRDVHFYNNFGPLVGSIDESSFALTDVDYRAIGRNSMVRYGSLDATEEMLIEGDGGHVGSVLQASNRILSPMYAMSDRWPMGDRTWINWNLSDGLSTVESFTDSSGRTSPFSVVLPPGYYDEDQQHQDYPVIYFMHGYGQRAEDLVATGLLLPFYMTDLGLPAHERMQKMILVVPDGRCRSDPDPEADLHGDDGCLRGTFYVDSWREDGPQIETGLIELMQYVDETYRTRPPADIEVRY